MVEETAYDARQIQVLEGLQAVRKRPAMYVGSVDSRGLHHLVHEVVDNSIDEAMAGFCKEIQVTLNTDGSVTVADDGRGIPVDLHPKYGVPGVELVLSRMHSGGKFERKMYRASGGKARSIGCASNGARRPRIWKSSAVPRAPGRRSRSVRTLRYSRRSSSTMRSSPPASGNSHSSTPDSSSRSRTKSGADGTPSSTKVESRNT